jgi:hypothetical protein
MHDSSYWKSKHTWKWIVCNISRVGTLKFPLTLLTRRTNPPKKLSKACIGPLLFKDLSIF